MTTSPVISQPYSYYNVLNPNNPLTDPLPATDDSGTAAASTTGTSTATADGSNNAQLSPDVMSLLQQILSDGGASPQSSVASLLSGDSNPTSALLGGTAATAVTNPLAGTPAASVVQQVYASALEAANNATLQVASSTDIGSQTVQSALAAYQSTIQALHPNPTSTSA